MSYSKRERLGGGVCGPSWLNRRRVESDGSASERGGRLNEGPRKWDPLNVET